MAVRSDAEIRHPHKVVFVVGPTASGKSAWALAQAQKYNGIILNADSIQFYKYLDIGSAKPSAEERASVPHFLYDVVAPDATFTAGDFYRQALRVIEENIRNHPVYVVGGSGFYFQALENGLFEVPPIPAHVTEAVDQWVQPEDLFAALNAVDPQAASRIGPNDVYRLRRALLIHGATGKTITQVEADFRKNQKPLSDLYPLEKIGFQVDREELRRRIEIRTELMFQKGWLGEVEGLLARGFGPTKALASVGYKECVEYLQGHRPRETLKPQIVTSTMQLAKRQRTWFKRDLAITWLSPLDRSHSQDS